MRSNWLCVLLISSVACLQGCGPQPTDAQLASLNPDPLFLTYNATNSRTNANWGRILKDVINHEAPGDSNSYDDQVTLAHETSHGIHSYIRNRLNTTGRLSNGFYVMSNRAVVVPEPNMRKSAIAAYVPTSLRGPRYATYITGQTAWDDTPLYVWDEWNAYVNGGEAGVDQAESGLWKGGWRDAVAGQLEFVVYAFASAMAVRDRDPNYFRDMSVFHDFLTWNAARTMSVYHRGVQIPDFKYQWQEDYLQKIRSANDAENFRQFIRTTYGSEWARDVLGI